MSVDIAILRHITGDALGIMHRTSSSDTHKPIPPSSAMPLRHSAAMKPSSHDLLLPVPLSLTPTLLSNGWKQSKAEHLSKIYAQAVARLKAHCELSCRRAKQALMRAACSSGLDGKEEFSLESAYLLKYMQMLHLWTEYIIGQAPQRTEQADSIPVRQNNGRPFNQDAVPILEQKFQENAFPTGFEKKELAMQTGMEYKQISIWFQNRRSRCGKARGDLSGGTSRSLVPKEIIDSVEGLLREDGLDLETTGVESTVNLQNAEVAQGTVHSIKSTSSFAYKAPPHAYPSPYPPSCPDNPFPLRACERNLQTPWPRTAKPPSTENASCVDVSAVTDALATLSLHDDCQEVDGSGSDGRPVLGFAVRMPSAPLPSSLSSFGGPSQSLAWSNSRQTQYFTCATRPMCPSKRCIPPLPSPTSKQKARSVKDRCLISSRHAPGGACFHSVDQGPLGLRPPCSSQKMQSSPHYAYQTTDAQARSISPRSRVALSPTTLQSCERKPSERCDLRSTSTRSQRRGTRSRQRITSILHSHGSETAKKYGDLDRTSSTIRPPLPSMPTLAESRSSSQSSSASDTSDYDSLPLTPPFAATTPRSCATAYSAKSPPLETSISINSRCSSPYTPWVMF